MKVGRDAVAVSGCLKTKQNEKKVSVREKGGKLVEPECASACAPLKSSDFSTHREEGAEKGQRHSH